MDCAALYGFWFMLTHLLQACSLIGTVCVLPKLFLESLKFVDIVEELLVSFEQSNRTWKNLILDFEILPSNIRQMRVREKHLTEHT